MCTFMHTMWAAGLCVAVHGHALGVYGWRHGLDMVCVCVQAGAHTEMHTVPTMFDLGTAEPGVCAPLHTFSTQPPAFMPA